MYSITVSILYIPLFANYVCDCGIELLCVLMLRLAADQDEEDSFDDEDDSFDSDSDFYDVSTMLLLGR